SGTTQQTPTNSGGPRSNPGRTLDTRSSATPGGNSQPECGPAPWWRSRPGSSLTGASGWTAAASSRAPAPKAPATISRSPSTLSVLLAQMTRIIALTALTTLGLSDAPVHEPVHGPGALSHRP